MTQIETIADFRAAMRHGPYAWPGGYPCYFVMSDGEAMSFAAARDCRREILEALRDIRMQRSVYSDWLPVALAINWEDTELRCAHSGKRIESAYGDDPLAEAHAFAARNPEAHDPV